MPTLILSRGSVDLRTPIAPNEGLALYGMLSRPDKVHHQYTADPRSKEIPSPKQLLNHEDDTYPPIGELAFLTRPRSPPVCPVNAISSTDAHEHNVSQVIGSRTEEEGPSCPVPQINPPKYEREMRRVSMVLRPVSSGGPAPQVLYPPPVRVRFLARRRPALPLPSSQGRSRQSIRHSQSPLESTHNIPQPRSPALLTPEEGLIQLRARTQQADSDLPLGYRRSFKHVRGLNIRALPTPPFPSVRPIRPLPRPLTRPLPRPPIIAPVNDHSNILDGADTRPQFKPPKKLVSPASSGALEICDTPLDTVLDIATPWSQKGYSPASKPSSFSAHEREDRCASTFLDLALQTPLSPKTQSNGVH